jgi:hypothetical protein
MPFFVIVTVRVVACVLIPIQRRKLSGLLLGVVSVVGILVWSGCQEKIPADKCRDRYFVRCLSYDVVDGRVLVTDYKSTKMTALDPWCAVIFVAADGRRTVRQFIAQLEAQYENGASSSLTAQTYQLLTKMEEKGLIRFTDQQTQLPYYLSIPGSQQNKGRALMEMRKDGFIK